MPVRQDDGDGVRKFLDSLPGNVRQRVESLREIQQRCDEVKERYVKEKRALEEKYRKLYDPLFEERSKIVIGDDEQQQQQQQQQEKKEEEDARQGVGAVPCFWCKVLTSADTVADHVTKRDEPILKYLLDVRCDPLENDRPGFKISFKFAPNPYFTPLVLEKRYFMGDDDSVLEKTEGTDIDWVEGKNPALKIVKKKPKKGAKEGTAPRTKTVQSHSFFDFFSPPELAEPTESGEADAMMEIADLLVEDDLELGCYLKEMLIPHAVSWYTGELADEREAALDGLHPHLDEDEDEDDDDDDDDDDDEEGES